MIRTLALAAAALISLVVAETTPTLGAEALWRPLDPQNTLVVETTKGRIVIEMRPELAPAAVERIKLLSRERLYDGLLFHRVVDHYVDQTGNPNNKDGGTSRHPNLDPEFDARLAISLVTPVAKPAGAILGFVGSTPVAASSRRFPDGKARMWGLYCAGVAGMGREASWDSANSEIFFMREPARSLDHDYTVWGTVVVGEDVVRKMNVGFPPAHPDKMLTVRVASDLPVRERPRLEVTNERSDVFLKEVAQVRQARAADFSPCDISIAVRGR